MRNKTMHVEAQQKDGDKYFVVIDENGNFYAKSYSWTDATLIAAAPKLLDVLGKSLASMEYVRKSMPLDRKDHDEYLVISEAIKQARAAIATVEGDK
jgi:hypothetical protein